MTNTVIIKRSGTLGAVPTPGDLVSGELALNYNDGNLFYKNASNVVTVIASNQFVSVTGNVTGSYFIGNGSQLTGITPSLSGDLAGNLQGNGYGANAFSFVSVTGNITGNNAVLDSSLTVGNVGYTGIDGIAGQFLATYGNGQTYFTTVPGSGGGNVLVATRLGGSIKVPIIFATLPIIGRTGNIDVPVAP